MRHLSIVVTIALSGSIARADGVGIAVTSRSGQQGALAQAVAAAVTATAEGRRVLDDAPAEARAAIAAGAVPTATLRRFRRVREEIDEGWRAYLRVQVDIAAPRLAAARKEAEELVAFPGGASLCADAALRLGAVLAHQGRGPDAQASLALALALDPDRPITLAEFSPDIVSAVDGARAQVRPAREVRITSEPAGAIVSIDDKELGRTPLHVAVASGPHVVVARMPLFHPRAQTVEIDAAPKDIALTLDRDAEWTALAERLERGIADDRAQAIVDATVRFADLDEIVLVADSEQSGGPSLLVQRCANIPARCTAIVEIGYADRSGLAAAAREAWQTLRSAQLRYAPNLFGDPRVRGERTEHRCKLCRSPLVWSGIGVAVLVGTIAAIAIATSSQPPPVVGVDPGRF